jgi:hypothetical protein
MKPVLTEPQKTSRTSLRVWIEPINATGAVTILNPKTPLAHEKTEADEIARLKHQLAQVEKLPRLKAEARSRRRRWSLSPKEFNIPTESLPQTVDELNCHHPWWACRTSADCLGKADRLGMNQTGMEKEDFQALMLVSEVRRLRMDFAFNRCRCVLHTAYWLQSKVWH